MLEHLKALVRDQLGLSPVGAFLFAGLVAHVLLNIALRKPVYSAWGLVAPLILGVTIEAYEIWVQYHDRGLFAPGTDPVLMIAMRHAIDVATILIAPLLLVVAGWLRTLVISRSF